MEISGGGDAWYFRTCEGSGGVAVSVVRGEASRGQSAGADHYADATGGADATAATEGDDVAVEVLMMLLLWWCGCGHRLLVSKHISA